MTAAGLLSGGGLVPRGITLLRGLSGYSEFGSDALPGDAGPPSSLNRLADLAFASRSGDDGPTKEILGDPDLVLLRGFVVFKSLSKLFGMIQDVLH
jgi:hypothetical protein